jgi:hypothetical protein
MMFVASSHDVTPASKDVALEIDLPDSQEPLLVEGEICWRGAASAAGIRITHMPVAARRRLANWILRAHHGAGDRIRD